MLSKPQQIYSWKSIGVSEETIKNPPGLDNTFASSLIHNRLLPLAKFAGNYLRMSGISL